MARHAASEVVNPHAQAFEWRSLQVATTRARTEARWILIVVTSRGMGENSSCVTCGAIVVLEDHCAKPIVPLPYQQYDS